MSVSSFEEVLARDGRLVYTNVGTSMLPLLRQGRDLFVVRRKGSRRCSVGDVVLYRRASGSYVLHRVIEVCADGYVTLGDNRTVRERGIRDADVLGVMTGYVRNGREHSTREVGYRLYSFLVLRTVGLRAPLKRCWAAAGCARGRFARGRNGE